MCLKDQIVSPRSKVLLEKVIADRKFLAFHVARKFIFVYTVVRYRTKPWPRYCTFSPHPNILFEIDFHITLPLKYFSPRQSSSFRLYKCVSIPNISDACCMPRLSYPSLLDHPNNILWGLQITKLFIMTFPQPCCYFLCLLDLYVLVTDEIIDNVWYRHRKENTKSSGNLFLGNRSWYFGWKHEISVWMYLTK